jgi:hypothetical protein
MILKHEHMTPTCPTVDDAIQVCESVKNSVTASCLECKSPFQTILFKTGKQQRSFCSDACRQTAYRKSPAHQACLDRLTNQRTNRRVEHFRRKNAFKSIGLSTAHSGPDAVGVPRVSMLDLKKFPKTPNPFVPFSKREWRDRQG